MVSRRIDFQHHQIPTKTNRVLYLILVAIFLVIIRIWHLTVVQYDKKVEESRKPQQKTVIEPAIRATIRDRFNLPLATNKISYQATILYSQLKDIPSFQWKTNEEGQRIRVPKKKVYIRSLAEKMGEELALDPDRIEDLIYSKASYYSQVPFVIKDELTESQYYRLKMMEREWPGIHVRKVPKRYYPMEKSGADVVGYMGAINRNEYEKILYEMKALEIFITEQESGIETIPPTGVEDLYQARRRLRELQAKAYTMHDYVGKTGIEEVFEQDLRGFYGKKIFYTNSKGNYLREFPGSRPSLPGSRIVLTLSSELQLYAEQLLAENEELRIVRKSTIGPTKKTVVADKNPWIKGGGIVVLEPSSGDLLALASYPRFNPNDFILKGDPETLTKKRESINRWFENEQAISQIWNLQHPLKRERYNTKKKLFYEEERWMTWENYLDFILPLDSPLRESMNRVETLQNALLIQNQSEALKRLFPSYSLYALFNFLYAGEAHEAHHSLLKGVERQQLLEALKEKKKEVEEIKKRIDPFLNHLPKNYDKVLVVDLCRLAVDSSCFSEELIAATGTTSLETYRRHTGIFFQLHQQAKEKAKELFHQWDFKKWRETEQKEFLKQKREEEKASKTYSKPYIDYIDKEETLQFTTFWNEHQWEIMTLFLTGKSPTHPAEGLQSYFDYFLKWRERISSSKEKTKEWMKGYGELKAQIETLPYALAFDYLKSIRFYEQLNRPLEGSYRSIKRGTKEATEKDLASSFYPLYGFGYGRSHCYRQASIQGSLFKIVTAYEALIQRFKKLGGRLYSPQELNPLTIIDQVHTQGAHQCVGYMEDGKIIPQLYKGGRVPRSANSQIGKVDLIKALEVSSNPYFALLAGDCLENPDDLSQAARLFSFGSKTGIDLPGEIAGRVPDDLSTNRTGLYATSIGQHTLVVTPLQTAIMLTAIGNGGKIVKPRLLKVMEESKPYFGEGKIRTPAIFPHQEALATVGIDFPLFSATIRKESEKKLKRGRLEIKREIFLPDCIRQMILKGLQKATERTFQDNLNSLTRLYKEHPEAIQHFKEMKQQLLGKTSTSESVEVIDLDLEDGTNIYTHVWFGALSVEPPETDKRALLLLRDEFGQPELVIVIYLRYGGFGKEAAPLAAQMVKKWRELKEKYNKR